MIVMSCYLVIFLIVILVFLQRKMYFINKKFFIPTHILSIQNYFADRMFFYQNYKNIQKKNLTVHYYLNESESYKDKLFTLSFVNDFVVLNINILNFDKNKRRIRFTLNRFKRVAQYKCLFALFFSHDNIGFLAKNKQENDILTSVSIFSNLYRMSNSIFPQKINLFHLFNLKGNRESIQAFKEFFEADIDKNYVTISQVNSQLLNKQKTHSFFMELLDSFVEKKKLDSSSQIAFKSLAVCSEIKKFFYYFIQERIEYLKANSGLKDSYDNEDMLIFKNLNYKKNIELMSDDISDIVNILDLKNILSLAKLKPRLSSPLLLFTLATIFLHILVLTIVSITSFHSIIENKKAPCFCRMLFYQLKNYCAFIFFNVESTAFKPLSMASVKESMFKLFISLVPKLSFFFSFI